MSLLHFEEAEEAALGEALLTDEEALVEEWVEVVDTVPMMALVMVDPMVIGLMMALAIEAMITGAHPHMSIVAMMGLVMEATEDMIPMVMEEICQAALCADIS